MTWSGGSGITKTDVTPLDESSDTIDVIYYSLQLIAVVYPPLKVPGLIFLNSDFSYIRSVYHPKIEISNFS